MNLPSREECFRLLKEFHTPENIMKHSVAVNKLCMRLGKRMKAGGEKINLELLDRASLLHDLDKFMTLGPKHILLHGKEAYRVLRERGYSEIAEIVRKHRIFTILRGELKTWEEKLVYYADKRVVHDKRVTVKEKIEYMIKTYNIKGKKLERLRECEKEILKLEREILNRAGEEV